MTRIYGSRKSSIPTRSKQQDCRGNRYINSLRKEERIISRIDKDKPEDIVFSTDLGGWKYGTQ